MEQYICTHALNLLSPLLMAAVTWASTKLAHLISARVRNERVRAVLLRLDDAIAVIIREIQQVTINEIKALTPDGHVPLTVRAQLKVASLASVKAYLGPKGIDEAIRALNLDPAAFDAFVATRVEAAVLDLKNSQHRNGVASTTPGIGQGARS
jgi:cobalamin biosynthesis protein CbiG